MPELPEVEVVRRGLKARLQNQKINVLTVRNASLRWPVPDDLAKRLVGRYFGDVQRRGKYLLFPVLIEPLGQNKDSGAPNLAGHLMVHLGMTGTLIWHAQAPQLRSHDHIDIELAAGVLRYNDPRRFGAVLWSEGDLPHPLLANLGVEPLSDQFTPQVLFAASRGRSLSVKQFLLAGQAVVGVGNIYCSESLFRARIRPGRACGRVTLKEYVALHEAIRQTLSEAIEQGGSTLQDFRNSSGESGYFQLNYFAYDRAGQPCKNCSSPIKLIKQQQRASYYCATCQR